MTALRENPTDEEVYDFGLHLLDQLLMASGYTLLGFGMPEPRHNWGVQVGNLYIAKQLSYDANTERKASLCNIPHLNLKQHEAFSRIVNAVQQCKGKLFFLDGPGGTGKTFVY